jgi:hypothetical protein
LLSRALRFVIRNAQHEYVFVEAKAVKQPQGRDMTILFPSDVKRKPLTIVGDPEHWDEEFQLAMSTSTAPEVMRAIEKALLAAKREEVSATAGDSCRTVWEFQGDDGSTWSARLPLKPNPSGLLGRTVLKK